MEKKVIVHLKRNYGRTDFYPKCELSKILCDMAEKKVLSKQNIEYLKSKGFEIEVKTGEID
jgi:hypothetical protein